MKAEMKGKDLVITIPLLKKPKPSSTSKTLIVCTSGGVKALPIEVDGQPIHMNLNGFIYPPTPASVKRNTNQETPEEDGGEE
jgi:hypothetical protein